VLKWIFKYWDGGVDWIEPTQDRDRSPALVNAAKIPEFHRLRGIPRLAEELLAFQEGLYSIELVS